MVRCDWLSGYIAFCREGRLAFVAVWKKREKTRQNNTVEIACCVNSKIDFLTPTRYNTDFSENFFFCRLSRFGTKLLKYRKYYSAIVCLLEAAFKIHLAQKSEGARALTVNEHDASDSSPSVNIWRRQKLKQIQQEDGFNSNTIESIIHYNASSSEKVISSESIILNL